MLKCFKERQLVFLGAKSKVLSEAEKSNWNVIKVHSVRVLSNLTIMCSVT